MSRPAGTTINVYSSEVEGCLAQHPAIALSAVIGVPHEKWGEAVMAVVVVKEGARVDAAELIAFVTERKGVRARWLQRTTRAYPDTTFQRPSCNCDSRVASLPRRLVGA